MMLPSSRDTEQAILNLLQHGPLTMDEILTLGQPHFTWNEAFLAIDRP
jgi:hypothetical protein